MPLELVTAIQPDSSRGSLLGTKRYSLHGPFRAVESALLTIEFCASAVWELTAEDTLIT